MYHLDLHYAKCLNDSVFDEARLKEVYSSSFGDTEFLDNQCRPKFCNAPHKNHLFLVDHDDIEKKYRLVDGVRRKNGDHHSFFVLCNASHTNICDLSKRIHGQQGDEILLWEDSCRDNALRCIYNITVPDTAQITSIPCDSSTVLANTIGMTSKFLVENGAANNFFWCGQFWFSYLVSTVAGAHLRNNGYSLGRGRSFWDPLFDQVIPDSFLSFLGNYKKKWIDGNWDKLLLDFATPTAGSYALSAAIDTAFNAATKKEVGGLNSPAFWNEMIKNLLDILEDCDSFIEKANIIINLAHSDEDFNKFAPRGQDWLGLDLNAYHHDKYKILVKPLPQWVWNFFSLLVLERVLGNRTLSESNFKIVRDKILYFLRMSISRSSAMDKLTEKVDRITTNALDKYLPGYKDILKSAITEVWNEMMELKL